jgi:hypothetical protein
LTKGKRKVTKIEKSQRGRKHKDRKVTKREKDIVRGREIKIEHICRGSKLMNYWLHLYVH